MRKVVVIAAIVLLLAAACACPRAHASNVGGDIDPIGNGEISIGAGGNFVANKHLRAGGDINGMNVSLWRNEIEYNQSYAKLALGVTDNFDLYCKLGAVTRMGVYVRATDGGVAKIRTDPAFLWGLGGDLAYKFGADKEWIIGLDSEFDMWIAYFRSADEMNGSNKFMNVSGTMRCMEMQLTPYVARKFSFFGDKLRVKPYVGMVYDLFDVKVTRSVKYFAIVTNNWLEWNFKSNQRFPLGVVVGGEVTLFKDASISVEGRFVNENALGIDGSMKFKF